MAKLVLLIVLALPFQNVHADGTIYAPATVGVNSTLSEYMSINAPTLQDKVEKALATLRTTYPDWNTSFKDGDWDCSEMASYLRYYLETCGIQTQVVTGDDTLYAGTGHVWLETNDGMKIEATTLTIPTGVKLNFYAKFKYRPTKYGFIGEKYELSDLKESDWYNSSFMHEQYKQLVDDNSTSAN